MSTTDVIASYDDLAATLTAAGALAEPAEVHGVIFGLLCAGRRRIDPAFLDELFDPETAADPQVKHCREALQALSNQIAQDLEEEGYGGRPLLPANETPLAQRAQAIVNWCEGLLYGLALAGTRQDQMSIEALEALRDLSELTHMDMDRVTDSEADEGAYTEIVEFAWVAALLIYQDLGLPERKG